VKDDPRCGRCEQPRSRHYHEDQDYCYANTNGEVFTSEPNDGIVLLLFEKTWPQAREVLVRQWKIENGHEVTE